MFTHLYISHAEARRFFERFAWKPDSHGVTMRSTLDAHFADFSEAGLSRLGYGTRLNRDKGPEDLFVIKFRDYLPHMPEEILDMRLRVVMAEIVRPRSAPTQARAGYYEHKPIKFNATIERIIPEQWKQTGNSVSTELSAPLYAQNIRVVGPSLAKVQEFNSKLSYGTFAYYLVNAFE